MEIQKNNKQGLTKVSSTVTVQYNVLEEGGSAREVTGSIYKDAAYAGMVSAYADGRLSLYLEAGHRLTGKEVKAMFAAAIDDAAAVFETEQTPEV